MSRYSDLKKYLCEVNCPRNSLEEIKRMYASKISSTRRLEAIERLCDLIVLLEKRDEINEDNVEILEHLFLQLRDITPPVQRNAIVQGISEANYNIVTWSAVLLYCFDELAYRLCYILKPYYLKIIHLFQRYIYNTFDDGAIPGLLRSRLQALLRTPRKVNVRNIYDDLLILILFIMIVSGKCMVKSCWIIMKILYQLSYPYLSVWAPVAVDPVLPPVPDDMYEHIIMIIANQIGHSWPIFARSLGITQGQIDELEDRHRHISERIRDILTYHSRICPDQHRRTTLFNALCRARRRDLALIVQNLFDTYAIQAH